MISIALSSSDRLYLSQTEADRLVDDIRQELTCRTTAEVDDLVVVADVSLTAAEAWRLVDRLESLTVDEIDWAVEGF